MPNDAISTLATVLKPLFALLILLQMAPFLIWLERKGASFIQDRIGPQRAHIGPFRLAGAVHVIADALKLFMKEDVVPTHVERFYYFLAPFIAGMVALATFAVVPWADHLRIGGLDIPMQALDLDIGIIWFLAISSLSVYAVVFAGWASNSKFPLLGGLRSSAQMLSYEIPMGLSLVGSLMIWQTLRLNDIVVGQGTLAWGWLPLWGVLLQPVGALVFTVCAFAEANRAPFDLAEGESELVAGYHTEYSSGKFMLFYFGEYMALTVGSALIVTLFFGGWQIPWLPTERLVAWANPVLAVMLALAALLALGFAWLMAGHRKHLLSRGFTDGRETEALVLLVAALIAAALLIGGLGLAITFPLPDWGRHVFAAVAQFGCFMTKLAFFCWVFVWVRWTLPRFRYDQLMNLGWRGMLPLSLANVGLTGVALVALKATGVIH